VAKLELKGSDWLLNDYTSLLGRRRLEPSTNLAQGGKIFRGTKFVLSGPVPACPSRRFEVALPFASHLALPQVFT